ncbi:FbpB family small basic protein [Ornithinibacillus sp. L9]|uniref:FbpB family small basic protein n=1 Tax=Ornithinibacillus caprae TaxID=2678566 RepID=A0A6N8FN77_9BACI|nr:FbpB family small basic protein [Ornithinibacillus caprae]
MSLKKRVSFDDLVKANRQQILEDRALLDRIEENIEKKYYQSLQEKNKEA